MKFLSMFLTIAVLGLGVSCSGTFSEKITESEKVALFETLVSNRIKVREPTKADQCILEDVKITNIERTKEGVLSADITFQSGRMLVLMLTGSKALGTEKGCKEYNDYFNAEMAKKPEYNKFDTVRVSLDTKTGKRIKEKKVASVKK